MNSEKQIPNGNKYFEVFPMCFGLKNKCVEFGKYNKSEKLQGSISLPNLSHFRDFSYFRYFLLNLLTNWKSIGQWIS